MIDVTEISGKSPSWRSCPFRTGDSYHVLQEFRSSDGFFGGEALMVMAGQAITFECESWSRYDSETFYLFRDSSGRICVWGLPDEEDLDRWRQFFQERTSKGQ
jgi:hypothetical protein